nr:hypothetical protein [uncultured Bacteroides sp.]
MNSLEIKDKKDIIKRKMNEIVDKCKLEVRTMTEDEQTEFDNLKTSVAELNTQLEEIKKELETYKIEEEQEEVQPIE